MVLFYIFSEQLQFATFTMMFCWRPPFFLEQLFYVSPMKKVLLNKPFRNFD